MPDPIRNGEYAHCICDFSGMPIGATDIDAFIDIKNRAFVFGEAKHENSAVPLGQRLALERLTDAVHRGGIPAFCFVVSHHDKGDIDIAKADVSEYRWRGQWHRGTGTFGDAASFLMKQYGYRVD